MKKYSSIEVVGLIECGDGQPQPVKFPDKPTMYGVYGKTEGGEMEWLSDHRVKESAVKTGREHSERDGIPLVNYVEQYGRKS